MEISMLEKISSGGLLVSDGATGTNLQARGLESGKPTEDWLFSHPEEVIKLHKDFIEAGADIILTNTFGASAIRLKAMEDNDLVKSINTTAVELARKAIGNSDVYIGGSMGPTGGLLKPYGLLDENDVYLSYVKQAKALSDAKVDLFVVETQFDLNEAELAVKAVRSVSDLPMICSFSYDRGRKTMMGVTPKQVVEKFLNIEIIEFNITMLGINCGRSLEDNLTVLKELKKIANLPIWFKPNAGLPQIDNEGRTIYRLSPKEMGNNAYKWIEAGAQVIGGCCGTTPEHLREISIAVKNHNHT